MRLGTLLLLLAGALSGCISARVHAGATVDTDGNPGFQGGVSFGIGVVNEDASALQISERIAGGTLDVDGETEGALDVALGIDGIRMPKRKGVGYRVGLRFGAHPAFAEEERGYMALGVNTALLPVLSSSRGGECHEKGLDLFCWRGRSWVSLGIETELSVLQDFEHEDRRGLGYLGAVFEFDSIKD